MANATVNVWPQPGDSDRDRATWTAQGIIAETCSRASLLGTTVMVTQSVYFTMIGLVAGDLVTNISMGIAAAGVSVTLSKVGLFDVSGNQLAVSADQGTNWQSTGIKTIAMGTPYRIPTTGLYYLGFLAVAGTGPTIVRGSIGAGVPTVNGPVGSGALPWGTQTGQADMPSPATIVVGTVAAAVWGAVS